jgi:tetratricopeptide (TPR) repeat protein
LPKAAVICAACGAKVRSDRVKCLRCGEPLVARQDAASPRPILWKTVAAVAACLAVGGFAVVLTGGSSQPTRAATSPMVAVSRVPDRSPARSAALSPAAANSDPAGAAASDLVAGQQAYASGKMDAAADRLQSAVDANPNDVRALNDLGQVLVRTGRAREAVAYLDKAASLKPDSWTYQFNRARAYAQLQEWGQAVEGYRAAAQLFPDDYATHYNLAKALQASGNINAALAAYEKAIALAPGQSDFQLSYGLALEAAKRPEDAATAYRRYLELEPNSPQAEKVRAHLADIDPARKASGS